MKLKPNNSTQAIEQVNKHRKADKVAHPHQEETMIRQKQNEQNNFPQKSMFSLEKIKSYAGPPLFCLACYMGYIQLSSEIKKVDTKAEIAQKAAELAGKKGDKAIQIAVGGHQKIRSLDIKYAGKVRKLNTKNDDLQELVDKNTTGIATVDDKVEKNRVDIIRNRRRVYGLSYRTKKSLKSARIRVEKLAKSQKRFEKRVSKRASKVRVKVIRLHKQ